MRFCAHTLRSMRSHSMQTCPTNHRDDHQRHTRAKSQPLRRQPPPTTADCQRLLSPSAATGPPSPMKSVSPPAALSLSEPTTPHVRSSRVTRSTAERIQQQQQQLQHHLQHSPHHSHQSQHTQPQHKSSIGHHNQHSHYQHIGADGGFAAYAGVGCCLTLKATVSTTTTTTASSSASSSSMPGASTAITSRQNRIALYKRR